MNAGRFLVVAGLVAVAAGLLVMLLSRLGLEPGKLPGDFVYRRGGLTVYVPLGTCILVSFLLWLIGKLFGR